MKKVIIVIAIVIIIIVISIYFRKKYVYMNETVPTKSIKFSQKGIDFIKAKEQLRLSPYHDVKGWSIGYGHFMGSVKPGNITKEMAENYLKDDIAKAEKFVKSKIKVSISQGLYDVLVMLAFNIGSFQKGLIDLVNSGASMDAIKERIKQYKNVDTDDQKIEASLLARRIEEIKTFIG